MKPLGTGSRRVIVGLLLGSAVALSAAAEEGKRADPSRRAPTHQLSPENFGLGENVTNLSPADFNPQGSATYLYSSAGYIYRTGGGSAFWAPVSLPNGVNVVELCVWYYNTSVTTPYVEWAAYAYPQGTGTPFYHEFAQFDLPPAAGYGVECIFPNTTIRSYADLDGNMSNEYPAYRVAVYLDQADSTQQLGGVFLKWQRQLSPAPAVATFNDVPLADFGFQYIEALVASGITGGTGGGAYSPDAAVTRRQMAIFIAKALGLYWPY